MLSRAAARRHREHRREHRRRRSIPRPTGTSRSARPSRPTSATSSPGRPSRLSWIRELPSLGAVARPVQRRGLQLLSSLLIDLSASPGFRRADLPPLTAAAGRDPAGRSAGTDRARRRRWTTRPRDRRTGRGCVHRLARPAPLGRTAMPLSTMRAERFYADTKRVVLEDVPIPEPGPGEVLVKVAFCGICHSDLSLINGTFPAQAAGGDPGPRSIGHHRETGPRRDRLGRGRPGGRRRRPAVPEMPELPSRRRGELPADPVDGLRLRRRVGRIHRGTGGGPDPGTGQRRRWNRPRSWPTRCRRRTAPWSEPAKVAVGESVGVWGVGGVGTHIVQLGGWSARYR